MRTQELFNILKEHQDKSLLFEYAPNHFVGANYHITEVKHIIVDSVDCGAKTDAWKETVIQLWESPSELGKRDFMKVSKALSILDKVGKMKPYFLTAEVRFEYSNDTFHTAQLFVNDFEIRDDNLILKLAVEKTDCKAKAICCEPKTVATKEQVRELCCSSDDICC